MADNRLLAADLLLRLGVDASGVSTEVASKLTAAERAAVASGDRIAAGVSRGSDKAVSAQLRVVAATEQYNAVLKKEGATQGQIASSQARLISAQRTYNRELAATEKASLVTGKAESSRLSSLKGIIAAGIAYKSVQFFKDSANEASDLAESTSKVGVVFGNLAPKIQAFAKDAPTAFGQSTQAALESTATFGNFFQALGLARQESAKMSTGVVKLAGDLASFNNENPADVLVALRSGLAGEVEPLRKYGIDLSDATLKQEAMREGLVKTTTGTLPGAIKAQVAYKLIMQQSTSAQGDFARTADGVANQQRIAAAETKNLEAAIGKGLIPAERDLLKVANELLPAVKGIAGAFAAVAGNGVARRSVEALALIAGGFWAANKAVKVYREISVNVLRRAPAQVTANAAVARSYDGIAAAADRAAVAEGRAAGAGAAGAGKGLGARLLGLAGTPVGILAGATVGVAIQQQGAQNNRRDSLVDKISASPQALAQAKARVQSLQQHATATGEGAGSFVEITDLRAAIAKAEPIVAKMARTQGAHAAATHKSAVAVQDETAKIKALQEEAGKFADRDPLGKLTKPDAKKALSPDDVLARLRGNFRAQGVFKKDVRSLIGAGANQETLSLLKGLEDSAPGTIHRIATSSGKQFQREFTALLTKSQNRNVAIQSLFLGAGEEAEKQGGKVGKAFLRGVKAALDNGEFDPVGYFTSLPNQTNPLSPVSAPAQHTTPRRLRASARQTGWPAP